MSKRAKSKKASPTKVKISYNVVRINTIKGDVHCPQGLEYADLSKYSYMFMSDVNLISDKSIIQIITNYQFFLEEKKLLDIQVENDFKVGNYKDVVTNGTVNNNEFLIFLIDISINHTRGIQSALIKDSPIANLYIPMLTKEKIQDRIRMT